MQALLRVPIAFDLPRSKTRGRQRCTRRSARVLLPSDLRPPTRTNRYACILTSFFHCDALAVTILLPTTYAAFSANGVIHVIHFLPPPSVAGSTDLAQPALSDQPHVTSPKWYESHPADLSASGFFCGRARAKLPGKPLSCQHLRRL